MFLILGVLILVFFTLFKCYAHSENRPRIMTRSRRKRKNTAAVRRKSLESLNARSGQARDSVNSRRGSDMSRRWTMLSYNWIKYNYNFGYNCTAAFFSLAMNHVFVLVVKCNFAALWMRIHTSETMTQRLDKFVLKWKCVSKNVFEGLFSASVYKFHHSSNKI